MIVFLALKPALSHAHADIHNIYTSFSNPPIPIYSSSLYPNNSIMLTSLPFAPSGMPRQISTGHAYTVTLVSITSPSSSTPSPTSTFQPSPFTSFILPGCQLLALAIVMALDSAQRRAPYSDTAMLASFQSNFTKTLLYREFGLWSGKTTQARGGW